MTTLYRPVLIESAEQAEALPLGTVALGPFHQAATRVDFGLGWAVTGDEMSDHHAELIGWTALVRIEAEEEWAVRYDDPDEGAGVELHINEEHARAWAYSADGAARSRLVTPWEEA